MAAGPDCDLVIVGAGPAGLAAARAAAGAGLRTLVLERLAGPGKLAHPCGGGVGPVPGFIPGRRADDGLHFPALGLVIPHRLVLGMPRVVRHISPGGYEFRAVFPARDDLPIATIDTAGLMRLAAEQAVTAGAELRYGTEVTGLVREEGRIAGVRTARGEVRARFVVSAEGVGRRLCEEAGLYRSLARGARYVRIVVEERQAPALGPQHVSQIWTFGKLYTSAPRAFGVVVVPAPGRAGVSITVFSYDPEVPAERTVWSYLEEYVEKDPRVRHLLAGSRVVERAACQKVIRDPPLRVVCDGFLGVGDAVMPAGHAGILTSMYLGRQAALAVAACIRAGDTTPGSLAAYERLFQGPLLQGVETQGKVVLGLTGMTGEEIDRLCQTLSGLNLAPFFYGDQGLAGWEALKWVARKLPWIIRDRHLLQRMLGGVSRVASMADD